MDVDDGAGAEGSAEADEFHSAVLAFGHGRQQFVEGEFTAGGDEFFLVVAKGGAGAVVIPNNPARGERDEEAQREEELEPEAPAARFARDKIRGGHAPSVSACSRGARVFGW
jgi:hypothetical protein